MIILHIPLLLCEETFGFWNGERHFGPSPDLERPLFLSLQRGDTLLDGFLLLLQAVQVLFEPGDLFLLGPEAWSKAGVFATTAVAAAVTAVMVAVMTFTVMPLVSTRHVLTSLP